MPRRTCHKSIIREECSAGKPFIMYGLAAIGDYLGGKDRNSILRMIKNGLVAYKSVGNEKEYVTSTTLVDAWIIMMHKKRLKANIARLKRDKGKV